MTQIRTEDDIVSFVSSLQLPDYQAQADKVGHDSDIRIRLSHRTLDHWSHVPLTPLRDLCGDGSKIMNLIERAIADSPPPPAA